MKRVRLCVNVDHVATVRNARGTTYPDPVHLAVLALNAGADGIVAHLREDRRHIRERDVEALRSSVPYFGYEFAMAPDVIELGLRIRPDLGMLVPERRDEVTTESGLDVAGNLGRVTDTVVRFQESGIPMSLFIDPDEEQVQAAAETGARVIELHTGPYSEATRPAEITHELARLHAAAALAETHGLKVHAGHGLRTDNVGPVAAIPQVVELSIGHYLVSRSLSVGIPAAVAEMQEAIRG